MDSSVRADVVYLESVLGSPATDGLRVSDSDISNDSDGNRKGFGKQRIGYLAGICLLCNNVVGPGLLQLPAACQAVGWLPTILAFLYISLTSTISATFLAKATLLYTAQKRHDKRIEYGDLCYHFLPRWAYYLSVWLLIFVFMSNNMSNILFAVQTMDETIFYFSGKDCGITIYPHTNQTLVCIHSVANSSALNNTDVMDNLFGKSYVISIGYAVTAAVVVPLSLLNLDDNAAVQVASVTVTLGCVAIWAAQFISLGLDPDNFPMYAPAEQNSMSSYASLLPTVLFNYGFVSSVPSWLAERKPGIPFVPLIWRAQILSTLQYLTFTILGALAVNWSSPALNGATASAAIVSDSIPGGTWAATKVAIFVFPLANIMTSIPILSIMTRYNLLQLRGPFSIPLPVANAVAVLVPWAGSLLFSSGNLLGQLITWSSAALFVQINFIIPIFLYIVMARRLDALDPCKPQDPVEVTADASADISERTAYCSVDQPDPTTTTSDEPRRSHDIRLSHDVGRSLNNAAGRTGDSAAILIYPRGLSRTMSKSMTELVVQDHPVAGAYFLLWTSAIIGLAVFALQVYTTIG